MDNRISKLLFGIAFAVLFAFSNVAVAGDLYLEIRGADVIIEDDSYDTVSDSNQRGQTTFGVGWGLDSVLPGARAYVVAAAGHQETSRFNGDVDFTHAYDDYLAAFEYGKPFGGFFRPYVRAAAGLATQRLEMEVASGEFSDRSYDVAAQGTGGFDLFHRFGEDKDGSDSDPFDFSMGLTTEVGYRWQTAATFDELAKETAGDDQFQTAPSDLGELSSQGIIWDLGIYAGFHF